MAKVLITKILQVEILRKFHSRSAHIFKRMKQLETQPNRGKSLGSIGGIVIKELKYKKFRFYFITDGHILKFGSPDEFAMLIIKFVRMSEKKDKNKAIRDIKYILRSLGMEGF